MNKPAPQQPDQPKDELLIQLLKELDEALAAQRFEECAALKEQIDARKAEVARINNDPLREVGLEELLNEIKRRTIAGTFAVIGVNEQNKAATYRMNWGDIPTLSGLRNWTMWDIGHELTRRVKAVKSTLYPPQGFDDEEGHRAGAFL